MKKYKPLLISVLFSILGMILVGMILFSDVGFNGKGGEIKDNFCGNSTYGKCFDNADCITGGCSAQICQSKNEEPTVSTCEYAACYNAEKYNLECRCVQKKCQWNKR